MCGRVLNNSYATSKWVAKTMMAMMESSDGVKFVMLSMRLGVISLLV